MLKFCTKHYTFETTGGQSWPNYIGLWREKTPSVSNQTSVYTLFPEGGVVWILPYTF